VAAERSLADFFRGFTDEWVRGNPNQAAATRYFSGEEQAALERQLTPETRAYRHARVELAKKGLAELAKFDPSHMTHDERISAETGLPVAMAESPLTCVAVGSGRALTHFDHMSRPASRHRFRLARRRARSAARSRVRVVKTRG